MNQENILPKISIIIPVFNGSSKIKNCLNYIYASEFKEFEVILVDDCSSDDTLDVAGNYPCRVLKNEINKGPAFSRNKGVDAANGELILFVDVDILILPDLIKKICLFFDSHKEISILQCRYEDIPHYKNLFSQYKHYIFSYRGFSTGKSYISYIHTACVALRKIVFQKIRFNENLRRREDIDFGLRCVQNGFLIYADNEVTVSHNKKYDLVSFSRYQFSSAKELTLQLFVIKNKNMSQEFRLPNQPLYKKLWFLRPFFSFLFLLTLLWLGISWTLLPLLILIFIFLLSFLVEFQFRLYLFKVAPLFISIVACFLYFYDGLLIGVGAIAGVFETIMLRICSQKSLS